MSKKSKYYAVKNGIKPGIYLTWDECLKQVDGYPNALYKSFKTLDEANNYLLGDNSNPSKKIITKKEPDSFEINKKIDAKIAKLKKDEAIAFVDGSYMENSNKEGIVGFGILIITSDSQTKLSGIVKDKDLTSFRNVTGEIYAAKNAIQWSINNNIKKVEIYYDYEGIKAWAQGTWKTNNDLTTSYAKYVKDNQNLISIKFHKVLAHSGIVYNEIVDDLAKEAINRNK